MAENDPDENNSLRSVALQNAAAVLQARQRGENDLLRAKERAEAAATELERALRRAKLSAEVAGALTGSDPVVDQLRVCVESMVRHLEAAFARIWTIDAAGDTLELRASAGLYTHTRGAHARVPVGALKIGLIAKERQPHLTNDLKNDPRVSDREWVERQGLTSFAGYPLLVQERVVGVVALFSRVSLTKDALDALASVADIIALSIERRRADAARADTEARNASILDAAMDCIIAIDSSGLVFDLNPAAERQLQRTRESVAGKETIGLLVPCLKRDQAGRELRGDEVIGKSDLVNRRVEVTAVRADGTIFPVEMTITPMRLRGSVAFTVNLRDITERRDADRRLADLLLRERLARASLSTILRSIGDAVIATDVAGRVTFMNAVAESLTGWSSPEAVGQPLRRVFRIVDERTRKEADSPTERVLRDGVVVGLANHTLLLARNGAELSIDDSAAPIRDDNGTLTGVVLVFRDVSAAKREADRREFLADVMPALASALDARMTLSAVARLAVPRLADWCAVEIVAETGRAMEQIAVAHIDPAKVALAEELGRSYPTPANALKGVANVIRTGTSELYREISDELLVERAVDAEHLRILTELRLRSAMIVPLRARGRILGAMTFVFAESARRYSPEDLQFAEELARRAALALDNAQLFESEQTARRNADIANRAKDDFLATVSHELRTPLNAMLGWTRMLRAGGLSTEKQERALATIERNAVIQSQLIEDLLDVSRIISGKLRLEVQSVEFADIIEQAIDALRFAAETRSITVVTTIDEHAGPMMGDPQRLQQVVWNLLSNAIKFTPKGGRIGISVERVDSSLQLIVSDSGRGIAPEFLPHVFERFKQADGSATRAHGGLGLGLAISRHIVELHGGTIEVKSRGEGCGATFAVLLPLSPIRRQTSRRRALHGAAAPGTLEQRPELKGLRVLVVDDEPDARELLVEVLANCGAVVSSAASVAEAMANVVSGRPDVVVADIGMPGEDGYELIRRIRALPPDAGGSTPAAALTAYARTEDRRKALDAGFMMHVPKPVEPAELIAVVANLTRFAIHH
ncbi:MAG: PAS domain S-box protein [Myxococcota bacterium]|nr:PAS domain S-box protein [Myxococcota bacterium]